MLYSIVNIIGTKDQDNLKNMHMSYVSMKNKLYIYEQYITGDSLRH